MFATEVGWLRDTDIDLGDYNWMKVSDIDQAHYLARAYHKARREWPWMGPMMLWNVDFAAHYPDTEHPHWFSVNGADLSPHRAYLTLKNAATRGPADLWVEKELISPLAPGQDLVYSIHYTNIGGQPATGVALTDTMPGGCAYVTDSRGNGTLVGDKIVWDVGTVDTGARETLTLTLRLTGDRPPGGLLTNTVEASALPNEPYVDDNVATVTTPISDLSIGKTVVPDTSVAYHGQITFTVVLSNSGLAEARGVLLTDTLPGEVDFARWLAQPGGAGVADDQITWSGMMTAGETVTFSFVVSHTGNYGDVVTNTGRYSHASGSGSDRATFSVESAVYLPVISKGFVLAPDLVVERVIATGNQVQVVIQNQGDVAVPDAEDYEFWVDLFVNPSHKPGYNETWETMGCQGAAWGITWSGSPYSPPDLPGRALPLEPGEVFTLTTRDDYYWWPGEGIDWPLEPGASVYAQVDSANAATSYGAVLENHEISGGPSNNTSDPSASVQGGGTGLLSRGTKGIRPEPDVSRTRLPERP